MAKTAAGLNLRDLARRRLDQLGQMSPEDWAKAVEGARKRGYQLLRFPGLTVEFRDYSLDAPDEP